MITLKTKRPLIYFISLTLGLSACAPTGKVSSGNINLSGASAIRNWDEFGGSEESDSYLDGEIKNVSVSKEELDVLVYRQVTSQNISSERDDRSLLEMDLTNMLATEYPEMSHQEIQEKVNQFGNAYQKKLESAESGINPSRQNVADQMEIASEIIGEMAGYVPNPKAFVAKWTMKAIAKGTRHWADSPDYDWMSQSQWSTATQSEGLRNRQEGIVKEYAELQQKDPRVRQVAYMIHDRRLGTSINYDAKMQFKKNPNALVVQNTEDIKNELGKMAEFLEQNIGPNGAMSVRFDEMEKFISTKFNQLGKDIRVVGESVLRVETKVDLFLDFSMEERRQRAQEQYQQFEDQQINMGKRAAVHLLGNIVGLGNSKAGHRIVTVGNAMLDIHQAIEQYSKSMAAIQAGLGAASAEMGTNLIMASNIFTAGFAIAGAFGSSGGNKAMMKMLAQMFKFLEKFRAEMHDRFDVIDERLNDIYDTMLSQFHQVFLVLHEMRGDLGEIKIQLRNVMSKLAEIENRVLILDSRVQNFSSDYWNYLGESTVTNCIELRQRTPLATISWIEFSKCLGSFVGLATTVAQNSSNTHANLVAGLPMGNDSAAKLNLLRNQNFRLNPTVLRDLLLSSEYQASGVAIPRGALPHLSIWNSAVRGYIEMLRIWPEYSLAGPGSFKLDHDAQRLLAPIKNVWSLTNSLRNPLLVEQVAKVYEQALTNLESQFARVYQAEVGKSIDQMTYRGEHVSGAAPTESYYESAGFPDKVSHCTEAHNFKDLSLPSKFRLAAPESMKIYSWLHPRTTKVCYEIDTKTHESSEAKSKEVRSGRGGVDGDQDIRTVRWTDYKCTVKYRVRIVWKSTVDGNEIELRSDLAQATEKSWALKDVRCQFGLKKLGDNKYEDPIDAPKTVDKEGGKYESKIQDLIFAVDEESQAKINEALRVREDAISLNAIKAATEKYVNSYLGQSDGDSDLRQAQLELDYRLEILRASLSLAYPESIRRSEVLPAFLFGDHGLRSAYAVGNAMHAQAQSELGIHYPKFQEEKYLDYLNRRVNRITTVNGKPRILAAFQGRHVSAEQVSQIFQKKSEEFLKNETLPFRDEVTEIEILDQQL